MKWLAATALMAAATGFGALPAWAEVKDFTVRNLGAAAINEVYASPNYSSSWEGDLLGSKTVSPGDEAPVHMRGVKEHCTYDIRIEDTDGHIKELYDEDLCQSRIFDFP